MSHTVLLRLIMMSIRVGIDDWPTKGWFVHVKIFMVTSWLGLADESTGSC